MVLENDLIDYNKSRLRGALKKGRLSSTKAPQLQPFERRIRNLGLCLDSHYLFYQHQVHFACFFPCIHNISDSVYYINNLSVLSESKITDNTQDIVKSCPITRGQPVSLLFHNTKLPWHFINGKIVKRCSNPRHSDQKADGAMV